MYTLGIPKRDYRRATQVLDYESQPTIPYHANLQDDGFYMFTFPEAGNEDDFRDIVIKLKGEGVRVIGADSQLTEKQIMKLVDLVPINEGTCGYSIDGKPADKPAGPHLIRKAIRKEIKSLHEEKGDKGSQAARKLIAKLREKTYRSFSDEDLDAFSKEMVLHLIDNPAAEAAVMMRRAKNRPDEYEPGTTDDLPFE
jgi:hypothetical protein